MFYACAHKTNTICFLRRRLVRTGIRRLETKLTLLFLHYIKKGWRHEPNTRNQVNFECSLHHDDVIARRQSCVLDVDVVLVEVAIDG